MARSAPKVLGRMRAAKCGASRREKASGRLKSLAVTMSVRRAAILGDEMNPKGVYGSYALIGIIVV